VSAAPRAPPPPAAACPVLTAPRALPRRRPRHQQPVRGLRRQQVRQRRPLGPGQRPLALLFGAADGGAGQRRLLLELLRRRLRRALVPQRPGAGAGLAALREDTAEGERRAGGWRGGRPAAWPSRQQAAAGRRVGAPAPRSEEVTPAPTACCEPGGQNHWLRWPLPAEQVSVREVLLILARMQKVHWRSCLRASVLAQLGKECLLAAGPRPRTEFRAFSACEQRSAPLSAVVAVCCWARGDEQSSICVPRELGN